MPTNPASTPDDSGVGRSLPMTDAQLRLAVLAEVTERRMCTPIMFRLPAGAVAADAVAGVFAAIAAGNPALSCRMDIEAGVQHRTEPRYDFADLSAESIADAQRLAAGAVNDYEEDLEGPNLAGRIIRTPHDDLLLVMLDHPVVDEESLTLIKYQLGAPPDDDPDAVASAWQRYERAVRDRVESEVEATTRRGVAFWRERLAQVGEELPRRSHQLLTAGPVHRPPRLDIPRIQGSVFPLILAALHRAVREIDGTAATVIGYSWGDRNQQYAEVLGCFINTILSIDLTGEWLSPEDGIGEFLAGWWRELDHVDVPFSAVAGAGPTGLEPAWGGQFDTILVLEHARAAPDWSIAGVPMHEIEPDYAVPNAPVAAAVVIADDQVRFRIVGIDGPAGERTVQIGDRWRFWLNEILTRSSREAQS